MQAANISAGGVSGQGKVGHSERHACADGIEDDRSAGADPRIRHREADRAGQQGSAGVESGNSLSDAAAASAGWLGQLEVGLSDTGRRAKFYAITRAGRKRLAVETENWRRISLVVERFAAPGGLVTELRAFLARISMVFRRASIEGEMEEEIRSHLDMAAEDYLREGTDRNVREAWLCGVLEASYGQKSGTAISAVFKAWRPSFRTQASACERCVFRTICWSIWNWSALSRIRQGCSGSGPFIGGDTDDWLR